MKMGSSSADDKLKDLGEGSDESPIKHCPYTTDVYTEPWILLPVSNTVPLIPECGKTVTQMSSITVVTEVYCPCQHGEKCRKATSLVAWIWKNHLPKSAIHSWKSERWKSLDFSMQAFTGIRGHTAHHWPVCHLLHKSDIHVLVPGQVSVSDYWTNEKTYSTYSFLSRVGQQEPFELAGTVAVDSEPRGNRSSISHHLSRLSRTTTFKESEKKWERGWIYALHSHRRDRAPHNSKPHGTPYCQCATSIPKETI